MSSAYRNRCVVVFSTFGQDRVFGGPSIPIRSLESQELLERIAASGAAGGVDHGIALAPSTPSLQDLLAKGYVCKMSLMGRTDHDHYTLTTLGRSFFQHCCLVQNPMELLQFKRAHVGKNLALFTTAELVLHLAKQGWRDVQQKRTKTLEPYRLDGNKVWYNDPATKISHLYLHALSVAADRFKTGCVNEIFHFQPQAYYRAIVENRKNVRPNQPLLYYKMLAGDGAAADEVPPAGATYDEISFDEPGTLPAITSGDGAMGGVVAVMTNTISVNFKMWSQTENGSAIIEIYDIGVFLIQGSYSFSY